MYGDYYYQPNAPPDEPLSSDRVTCHISKLFLIDYNVSGTFPDSFRDLTHLTHLHMGLNSIHGPFPKVLYDIQNLTWIDIGRNQLTFVPDDIHLLQSVEVLNLFDNPVVGTIPAELGLITSLFLLTIGISQGLYGTVPESLSNLVNLRYLWLGNASLTGTIPTSLYTQCTQLKYVFVNANHFSGPHNLELLFEHNQGGLLEIDYSRNLFTGQLPTNYYIQTDTLRRFWINGNHLSGTIPDELTTLTTLDILDISNNHFSHSVPPALMQMTNLKWLFISNSLLTGTVPETLGNMTDLMRLKLDGNFLTGSIPPSIFQLKSILQIILHSNHMSGTIPTDRAGEIPTLQDILLQNNMFTGNFEKPNPTTAPTAAHSEASQRRLFGSPTVVPGQALSLMHVDFSNNRLKGTLPHQLFMYAPDLISFAAGKNCVQGTIPEVICSSSNLQQLMLDGMSTSTGCVPITSGTTGQRFARAINRYADTKVGTIPPCLFAMPSLVTLHLSGNGHKGSLPDVDYVSPALQDITLSHNELTGSIPRILQRQPWHKLDLSYNKLTDTLVSNFAPLYANSSLSLIVNRLSGPLPASFRDAPKIAEITDNLQWELLRKIKRMFLRVTGFVVCVFLPVYCVLTHAYKSYLYSYAWSTSAIYLSGRVPSIVCGLMWFLFLLFLFYRCESVLFRDEFRDQVVNQRIIKKNRLVVENTRAHILSKALFTAFNIVAVFVVNVGYVYVGVTYSVEINVAMQVGLAVFRLFWNSMLLPACIALIYRKPVIGADVSRPHAKIIQNQAEMNAIVFETVLN
eukprot:gene28907-35859_t